MSRLLLISKLGLALALCIMLSASCIAAERSGKKLLRTYLLLGQSNMEGWGDYSSLDKKWANALERNERIHFCASYTRWQVARLKAIGRTVDKPYKVKGTFGPEYSFIDAIVKKNPRQDILFLKHSVGGTTLYAAWDKEWTLAKAKEVKEHENERKHRLYATLLEKVKVLQKYAKEKGYAGIDIVSVLWVQGESDALHNETGALAYKANLTKFISNLRADLPDADFRFIYFQVNSMKFRYIEHVRKAQLELADELENVYVIKSSADDNPKDFPKYDAVHYNAAGVINIGKALAKKSK